MNFGQATNVAYDFLLVFDGMKSNPEISRDEWERWLNNPVTVEFKTILKQISLLSVKAQSSLSSDSADFLKSYNRFQGEVNAIERIFDTLDDLIKLKKEEEKQ